jgi:hypothetical protein
MEIWKPVKDYEGYYEVSSFGRVKSIERIGLLRKGIYPVIYKEKILKNCIDGNGYSIVSLSKNNIKKTLKVHHLVSECFLNHVRNGFVIVVDHIDRNKLNNNLNNLQLISQRENTAKKINNSKFGTGITYDKRSKRFMCRLHNNGIREYLGCFKTQIEANNAYINKLNSL